MPNGPLSSGCASVQLLLGTSIVPRSRSETRARSSSPTGVIKKSVPAIGDYYIYDLGSFHA